MARLPANERALERELRALAWQVGDSPELAGRKFNPRSLWSVSATVRAELAYQLMLDALDTRTVWPGDGNATANLLSYARYYLPGRVDDYIRDRRMLAAVRDQMLADGYMEVWQYEDDEDEPTPVRELARPEPAIERMIHDMAYWHSWEHMTVRHLLVLAAFGAKGTASDAAPCVGVSRNTYAKELREARAAFYAEFFDPAGTGEQAPTPPRSARDERLRRDPREVEEMLDTIAARRAVQKWRDAGRPAA
jgi:hypothetical protein